MNKLLIKSESFTFQNNTSTRDVVYIVLNSGDTFKIDQNANNKVKLNSIKKLGREAKCYAQNVNTKFGVKKYLIVEIEGEFSSFFIPQIELNVLVKRGELFLKEGISNLKVDDEVTENV